VGVDGIECGCQSHGHRLEIWMSSQKFLNALVETKIMKYVYSLPTSPSFVDKGLLGYVFGPLNQKDLEIYYIEVEKGHDVFMISKRIVRTYYILSGSGHFTIANRRYDVSPGMLVEVPPKVEYSYSGKMKLIAVSKPRWFSGNDKYTKWNPDVIASGDFTNAVDGGSLLTRLIRSRIFGKSPISAYLRLNQRLWNRLPASCTILNLVRSYGNFLHALTRIQAVRGQLFHTFFMRNRPALELIRRLVERSARTDMLRVAVLACSTGPEAYSVAWTIRSARPDLKLILHAVDNSQQALEFAENGVYSVAASQFAGTDMFDHLAKTEIEELFDKKEDLFAVKSWIKEGIRWHVGDVSHSEIVSALGPQDIVVANNFICHMNAPVAERCLRNIACLVAPHGYLFVSGIDLDIRTKVAKELGWNPLQELLEEIHEGDPRMASGWPFNYSSLEPLNKGRRNWSLRYAAAFQLNSFAESESQRMNTAA
jgi:chemotaxis methyl-accepting protein methylase/mannose-6-phosphate isomerase-like protein (cupin superfamily)